MDAAAARGDAVLIAAPPGTGKSAVLPHLVRAAAREAPGAVVADIDEILQDGALLGIPIATPAAASMWPAYDRLWSRIAEIIVRSGTDLILLIQVPDPAGPALPGVLWGWEIPAGERSLRLRRRGDGEDLVADAEADARVLRRLVPPERLIRTPADLPPAQSAEALLAAVRSRG